MGGNPSRWKGPRNSVEYVSFDDVDQFCQRLTQLLLQQDLITANERVRLPTETEWEYCCRAGTDSLFSFPTTSNDPWQQHAECDRYAWHTGNAAGNDPPVGALAPNPWGLYDMHGYLWEMTSDAPHSSTPNDRTARYLKTIRGGSWRDETGLLTSATRLVLPTHAVSDAIGFRCIIASD
jgi:formylglycine-generating enzyme required for sulfatase activity